MKKQDKSSRPVKPTNPSTTTTATTASSTTSLPVFFNSDDLAQLPERSRTGDKKNIFNSSFKTDRDNQKNTVISENAGRTLENTANEGNTGEVLRENLRDGPEKFFARRAIKPIRSKQPEHDETPVMHHSILSSKTKVKNYYEASTPGFGDFNPILPEPTDRPGSGYIQRLEENKGEDNTALYLNPVSYGTDKYQTFFKINKFETTEAPGTSSFNGQQFIDMSSNTRKI